jgi:hypothetical protein
MSRRQKAVEHFIRDIFRIKAEIIAEHFEPEILSMMTGIQVTPEMSKLMKSDVLRAFNVDVESDSTVLNDQQIEQESRARIVETVTAMVSQWAPILKTAPQLGKFVKSLVLFQLQSFKHSRTIEESLEKAFDQLSGGEEGEEGQQQQPQVDPMQEQALQAQMAEQDAKVAEIKARISLIESQRIKTLAEAEAQDRQIETASMPECPATEGLSLLLELDSRIGFMASWEVLVTAPEALQALGETTLPDHVFYSLWTAYLGGVAASDGGKGQPSGRCG